MSARGSLAIFTICSNNYVPMAKILLASAAAHHPEADIFLVLADRMGCFPGLYEPSWTVLEAEQLDIPGFRSFAFRYDIMELNTAVKPFAFLHLMEERGYEHVIYFDPDIEIHRPLSAVLEPLRGGSSFVLTPHALYPLEEREEPDDTSLMRAGAYNLGFLAVRRCEESVRIVRWWARRLRYQCINAQDQGIFVDQKFMDLVPGFARGAHVSHDPSLNVAYWNLSQRVVGRVPDAWTINGERLTFFHFSGFDPRKPHKLSKYTSRYEGTMPALLQRLVDEYGRKLIAAGHGDLPANAYAYGRFNSGAVIHPYIRRMLRDRFEDWPTDPFWTFEQFLDEPSAQVPQFGASNRITNFMKYVYDVTPELNRVLDLSKPEDAGNLVHWFVFHAERDIGLDPRLAEPAIERMERPLAISGRYQTTAAKHCDASVIGYLQAASGVGEAGRQTLLALAESGLRVEGLDVDLNLKADRNETSCEDYLTDRASGRVQIFHINADQMPQVVENVRDRLGDGAVRVCVPFWELGRFPRPWLGAFDHVDEVWAPSRFIERALMRDVGKPVVYMPMSFDLPAPSRRSRVDFGLPDDAFLFFFAFDFLSFVDRKNPLAAVAAFKQFRRRLRDGRAMLVVKSMNGILAPMALAAFRAAIADEADIVLLDETMTREDTLALLAAVDCVVSLHRSEGFGFLIAEAITFGKPVIATDYSATTELISPETGFPVGYRLVPVREDQYPFGEGQVWADPDTSHAAWHMGRIFDAPRSDAVRSVVERARTMLRDKHGRGQVAARQARRISQLVA